ncbi:MAG: VWA domain-containing protein, partial [Gammaproteobacteria bacterium]|nr:VWA domain-containing protein [Gammaproteobacteria bacterium]
MKTLTFLLLIAFIFGVVDFSKNDAVRNIEIKNIEAAEISCKGPAAVVLAIDRSGSMVYDEKFNIVKIASINFMDNLFLTSPDDIYGSNAYHQIGLVAFNNSPDSKPLNKNEDDFMQGVINDSNGILGDAYPLSYRGTAAAIDEAKDTLDLNINPFATKTMIVLTDGSPHYSIDDAIANANSAKNDKGIRVIAVGLKLDNIADETERTKAEGFIKDIASAPFDCYYTSDSGGVLEGCTSISAGNLANALESVYSSITTAICDESPPVISISKKPFGTLYNVDNLTITSTVTDDVGFKSHSIIWGDDNTQVECADLIGTTVSCDAGECVEINCDTGGLDPFGAGEAITYRSIAMDANDNEVNIDPPKIVTVADVNLTVPELFRNENNIIEVVVYNYGGNDNISISIDAPSLTGIEKELMSCSDSGSTRTCVYDFDTKNHGDGCLDWTDGITDGAANNIDVNVYIYAES